MRRAISQLGAQGKQPVRLTSIDDALNYAAWAANEFARKRLTVEQMKAVDQLLARFAALIKARDQDTKFAEMKRMLETLETAKGGKGK